MSASVKCQFAKLKYEQLLWDKYFITTCFSRKQESLSSKEKLINLLTDIKFSNEQG